MTHTTYYSQASAAQSETHDAYLTRSTDPTNNTWASFRTGAGTHSSYDSASLLARIMSGSSAWIVFMRSQMTYNTSDIGTDDITSAKWESVARDTSATDHFTASVTLCASNPTYNSYSTAGDSANDYSRVGTTKYSADLAIASQTHDNSTYTTFNMNAAGLDAIDKTGITKLGIIITEDFDDDEPDESHSYGANTEWKCWSTDETESGERRPRLVVTHASPFTPKAIMF